MDSFLLYPFCMFIFLLCPGLGGSFLSSLDATLVPENLFRICVDHEWKFVSSDTSAHKYNIYKVWKHPHSSMKIYL